MTLIFDPLWPKNLAILYDSERIFVWECVWKDAPSTTTKHTFSKGAPSTTTVEKNGWSKVVEKTRLGGWGG